MVLYLSVALLAVFVFSPAVVAQTADAQKPPMQQGSPANVAEQPGKDVRTSPPAPERNPDGAWIGRPGERNIHDVPPMTALGESRFKRNKPEREFTLAASNDPFTTCDPLGFPRDLLNQKVINAGMWFEQVPDRMIIMYQTQRVWREIWMDGRELPKNVDVKGGAPSRWYGYSVGHWEGDNTLVVNTVGSDDRSWLDNFGHPHSVDMHVQERYTRVDHDTMNLTVSIDDPKIYTKSFEWLTDVKLEWAPKQDLPEDFCVPSDALEYMKALVKPAGLGEQAK